MTNVRFHSALLLGIGALFIVRGASADAPPLDQLPLRDALLARPEVIGGLSAAARQQLAQRFETARRNPTGVMRAAGPVAGGAVEAVRAIDEVRIGERSDALIAGTFFASPAGLDVQPFADDVSESGDAPPPLDWVTTEPTSAAEQSALAGRAGAIVRRLLLVSESSRLVRVVSWPVAVVAIDHAVYLNASWLLAMSTDSDIKTPDPVKSTAQNAAEPGCGGGMAVSSSTGAGGDGQKGVTLTEEGASSEQTTNSTTSAASGFEQSGSATAERGKPELQKLFDHASDGEQTRTAHTAERTSSGVHAESLPPDQRYSYSGAASLANPADCCKDPNACGGADSSCAGNATTCSDPNSSCSTSNCNNSSCNNGSCNNSSCNDSSSCSSSSCNNSSCNNSSCSSSSCSSSSCSNDSCSSSSCNSGSNCSSGSNCNSGSDCGKNDCNLGKCTMTPPRVLRRPGDIPDSATLCILLIPLWYLVRQGRRRSQS